MNMISTGAFPSEMNASEKQLTAVEKFAAVWEKKNAKAARAGGVSLMALSLAACGSSSSTTTTTSTDTTTDTTTTPVDTTGLSFALTSGTDVFQPNSATAASKTTANDDTIRGGADGDLASSDIIDAGAGNDTLTANVTSNSQTLAPSVSNVETVTLAMTAADTKSFTLNATDVSGANIINIKNAGAVSMSTNDELITLNNVAKTTTVGIIGGTASTAGTGAEITVNFASAKSTDTQNIQLGKSAKADILTLSTAKTVTLDASVAGTTAASTLGQIDATAVTTFNVKGAGDVTIDATDFAAKPTIDASEATGSVAITAEAGATTTVFTGGSGKNTFTSASTGKVTATFKDAADTLDVSGGNGTVTATMGGGDDTAKIGASSTLTAVDSIDGGAGKDTLIVTDATLNASTKTAVKEATNFEVLGTSAQAELTIDFNALSVFDEVTVTRAGSATAAAATSSAADGSDAVNVVIEAGDTLKITDARVGQAGSQVATNVATSKAGGDGLELAPKVDSGSDVASITLVGNADITGGAGGRAPATDADQTGGAGGMGINASNIETLNLHIVANETSADTITVRGGAGGGAGGNTSATVDAGDTAGADGADVTVGTNAKIVLTDELTKSTHKYSAVDLGTVKGTNVEIDGSALDAALTVTAADGNVKITGGAKNDVLKGGTGQDTLVGGAGNDDLQGNAGKDTLTGGAGKDTFSLNENASGSAVTAVTDIITDMETGLGTDTIVLDNNGAVIADKSGTDVSAAVTGTSDLTATTSKGIITLSGAGVSLVDTVAEVIDIFELMDAAGTEEFGAVVAMGNTYVIGITSGNVVEEVVQLTGLTGAAISLTDAADTILIA